MVRKNIFEILGEKYDIKEEIEKIDFLFNNALLIVHNNLTFQQNQGNVEAVVQDMLFYNWKQRGACLSCEEIRKKVGIDFTKNEKNDILISLEY